MKKAKIDQDILAWITKTPASDLNFRNNLTLANLETIEKAIEIAEKQKENKARLKALRSAHSKALRKQNKGGKEMAGDNRGVDLSGLDNFDVSGLLGDQPLEDSGKPLFISLDQIQPDINQPRKEFDPKKLEELAESIKARGVKSPISVKPKNDSGFYIINHGERRWLASKKAGLKQIPAFIDDDHNHIDQAVENIQRDNLTPLEVAHFIERCLSDGMKKNEIAKVIGKPASWVSDHALFFEFPDYIRDLYDSGRCRSIQALAALHRGYKEYPGMVAGFCSGDREITTKEARDFLAQLKKDGLESTGNQPPGSSQTSQGGSEENPPDPGTEEAGSASGAPEKEKPPVGPSDGSTQTPPRVKPIQGGTEIHHLENPAVQVQHDDRAARLILDRKPSGMGRAWLRYEDDGSEIEADLVQVELVAIIEG